MENNQAYTLSISDLLRTDSNLERFLLCTPFSDIGAFNYDNALSKELFYSGLYIPGNNEDAFILDAVDIIKSNRRKSIFVLGNQGCGKTTFVHTILKELKRDNSVMSSCIDFAELASPLTIDRAKAKIGQEIYAKLRYAIRDNKITTISSFVRKYYTYEERFDIIWDENNALHAFFDALRNALNNNEEDLLTQLHNVELRQLLGKMYIFQLFLLMVLFDMEEHEYNPNYHKAIVLDNLDSMVDIADISSFIDNYFIFESNMSSLLRYIAPTNFPFHYTFVFVMREVTKAHISQHAIDAIRITSKEYDLTAYYSKKDILMRRLQQYQDFEQASPNLALAKNIYTVVSDSYMHQTIFPFYNNDYRICVMKLCEICSKHPRMIEQYQDLISGNEDAKFGGRGIIYRLILSDLKSKGYFSRLMIVDFNTRQNKTSLPRLLLTYLSNQTRVSCLGDDDIVSLKSILKAFEIVTPSEIVECLWAMFDLIKTNDWNHLITFASSKNASKERLADEVQMFLSQKEHESYREYSHFRITCAGEIYLSNVCTHYEFFSCRALGDNYLPLFCKENLQMNDGQYGFEIIIDSVYKQAYECCKELNASYESSSGLCREAKAPYNYKSGSIFQFHSERIVFSHIGYLDAFRCYILNNYQDNSDLKLNVKDISVRLLSVIKSYCNLISTSIAKCAATKSFKEILGNLADAEVAPTDANRSINKRRQR